MENRLAFEKKAEGVFKGIVTIVFLLVIILVLLFSIKDSESQNVETWEPDIYIRDIQGCEYVFWKYGNGSNMAHLESCKNHY